VGERRARKGRRERHPKAAPKVASKWWPLSKKSALLPPQWQQQPQWWPSLLQ